MSQANPEKKVDKDRKNDFSGGIIQITANVYWADNYRIIS